MVGRIEKYADRTVYNRYWKSLKKKIIIKGLSRNLLSGLIIKLGCSKHLHVIVYIFKFYYSISFNKSRPVVSRWFLCNNTLNLLNRPFDVE